MNPVKVPGTKVAVVCGDGGQHRPARLLGTLRIWGTEPEQVEVVNNTIGPTDDEHGVLRDSGGPDDAPHHTETWTCRKCGRTVRINRTKLIEAGRGMIGLGANCVDISAAE